MKGYRYVQLSGEELAVGPASRDGFLNLCITGYDGASYATPEQALEAAQVLVEAALEIINARPAQALVVPGIGLTSVQG